MIAEARKRYHDACKRTQDAFKKLGELCQKWTGRGIRESPYDNIALAMALGAIGVPEARQALINILSCLIEEAWAARDYIKELETALKVKSQGSSIS